MKKHNIDGNLISLWIFLIMFFYFFYTGNEYLSILALIGSLHASITHEIKTTFRELKGEYK
jgi:phage-related holin